MSVVYYSSQHVCVTHTGPWSHSERFAGLGEAVEWREHGQQDRTAGKDGVAAEHTGELHLKNYGDRSMWWSAQWPHIHHELQKPHVVLL